MKNKILLTICLTLVSIVTLASGFKDFKWSQTPERVEIPERFQNEDAVIVESNLRYTMNMFNIYQYTNYYTKQYRVRILTKDGISSASRVLIPKYSGSKITVLDARTIKANGEIVDMKSDDIKELDVNLRERDIKRNEKFYLFSIPGVEVGDEIEVIYVMEDSPTPYTIFLHEELPVIHSEYILSMPINAVYEVFNANGMPRPQINKMETKITCTWALDNLPGTADQDYGIESLELPHVIQIIRGLNIRGEIYGEPLDITWPDYFYNIEKIIHNDEKYISKKYGSSIENLLEELWVGLDDNDVFSKMKAVHNYLNNNMEIVNMSSKESSKHLGYFIENKKISQYRLLTLYMQIFRKAQVKYHMAFGRDKYNGLINPKVVTMNQVDYLFFGFTDQNNKRHYLFPKTNRRTFEINELPPELHGTTAITISSTNKRIAYSEVLPTIPVEDISRIRKIEGKVNLESNNISYEYKESLSGSYSAFLRNNYINSSKNGKLNDYFKDLFAERNESMKFLKAEIDSFSSTYPYTFNLKYNVDLDGPVTKIDEGLYSISIDKWFWHSHDNINKDKRWMKYFPNFPHVDLFQYYLVFEDEIELVNAKNLNNNVIHQQIGGYFITAKQVNPKVILLESKYLLSGGEIDKDAMSALTEIYEAMDKGDNEPLVVKLKQ